MSPTRIDSLGPAWRSTRHAGVSTKPFARYPATIERLRLSAGCSWTLPTDGSFEVIACDGEVTADGHLLGLGGYVRQNALSDERDGVVLHSEAGCDLLVREGLGEAAVPGRRIATANDADFMPGHGGLRIRPLHSVGTETTALVFWPAGECFVPHRHRGGAEIFVLSGVFEDEQGRYPAGTWLLSPHLSQHHPFVREETLIFVKSGHVPVEG